MDGQKDYAIMDETTFTLPSLDGIVFHVTRGGESGMPSNWMKIVATQDDSPTGFEIGFQGP